MIGLKYIHKNYPLYSSLPPKTSFPCCFSMPPSLPFLPISKDRVDFMMELRFALEVAQSRSLPALLCRFLLSPERRIFPPNKNNALMSFGTCGGFEHWPWFLRHARPKYMFAEIYIYIICEEELTKKRSSLTMFFLFWCIFPVFFWCCGFHMMPQACHEIMGNRVIQAADRPW